MTPEGAGTVSATPPAPTLVASAVKPDEKVQARFVQPVNPVHDMDKMEAIAYSMAKEGWQGSPVLVLKDGDQYMALTGSHRIYAAIETDTEVPVSVINMASLTEDEADYLENLNDDVERLELVRRIHERGAIPGGQLAIMEAEVENNYLLENVDYSAAAAAWRQEKAERYARQTSQQREKERTVNEEAKLHLETFVAKMRAKYGENMWANMTDDEMDTYEKLEAATYR